MDDTQTGAGERPRRRRRIAAVGLVAGGLALGTILAGTTIAGAAQGSSSTATPSVSAPAGAPATDPATLDHGPGETLLTGTRADAVSAAALDEVPGGTIIRVETDSDGATYEAHVRASDGSVVTVMFDKDLNVTGTESGFGAGPAGSGRGQPPSGAPSDGSNG